MRNRQNRVVSFEKRFSVHCVLSGKKIKITLLNNITLSGQVLTAHFPLPAKFEEKGKKLVYGIKGSFSRINRACRCGVLIKLGSYPWFRSFWVGFLVFLRLIWQESNDNADLELYREWTAKSTSGISTKFDI